MTALDFLGKELNVGDDVVQLSYRNLLKGTIKKITPKTLIISHERTNVGGTETKQFHDQVIKIWNYGEY